VEWVIWDINNNYPNKKNIPPSLEVFLFNSGFVLIYNCCGYVKKAMWTKMVGNFIKNSVQFWVSI
jgi:hypothetical protein